MDRYSVPLLKGVTSDVTLQNLETMILNHITYYMFSNVDYIGQIKPSNWDDFIIENNDDKQLFQTKMVEKLVKTRYGICLDLNYVFSVFLTSRGYENYLIKCWRGGSRSEIKGIFHLGIIVMLKGNKYFVDVGFGDYFTGPVLLQKNKHNYLYVGKTILQIVDEPIDISELIENFTRLSHIKTGDFVLGDMLFERIYDIHTNQYINPRSSKL